MVVSIDAPTTSRPPASEPVQQTQIEAPVGPSPLPDASRNVPFLRLYVHLALTALLAFGGFTLVFISARLDNGIDIGALVFVAGSVGAVVNNYYRLAKISADQTTAQASRVNSVVIIMQFYVSFLISGALGVVMYILCLSNFLDGALFPDFESATNVYSGIGALLQDVRPATNLDAAKAILWAFLAGFSERFIPNILDRFVIQAQNEQHGRGTSG
jgi:hypothetical protein